MPNLLTRSKISFASQSRIGRDDPHSSVRVHDTTCREITPVEEICNTFEAWTQTMDKQAMAQQEAK